jgi:hypothetical protein
MDADPVVFELGDALWKWLKRQRTWDLTYDAGIYSQYAWDTRKNEPYGRGALFTITSEGPLSRTINQPSHPDDFKLIERFHGEVARLGLHYEMGYHWSFHFYPDES